MPETLARCCATCGVTLPEQKRGRPRKFCTTCVPAGSGKDAIRAWRQANPERVLASNDARRKLSERERWQTCQHCRGRFFNVRARRYCSDRCMWRASAEREDPEKRRARDRKRAIHKNTRRRGALMVADQSVRATAADVRRLLAEAKTCPLCRKRLSDKGGHPRKKHVDHIVPIAAGGLHTIGNLRVLCATCNISRPSDASDVDQEVLWARR